MASIEYVVNAVDNASGTFRRIATSTDTLKRQLDDLSRKVATPTVDLNDKNAQLKIADAAVKLNRLSEKIANPKVEVDTARAQRDILKIDAMLDALGRKDVTIGARVDRHGGILGRLGRFGSLLGGAGRLAGTVGSGIAAAGTAGIKAFGNLPPQAQGGIIAGAAGAAPALAALASAGIPVAAGGGIGVLGAILASGGKLKKTFADVLSTIRQDLAPLRPLFDSVFDGVGKFAKSIGPGLRDVFAESVPYLQMFVKFGEQAARVMLPALSQLLRGMIPFLPTIDQGLLAIVKGFAGFLNALGPRGMQQGAKTFLLLAKVIQGTLLGLGKAVNFLAVYWGGEMKVIAAVSLWLAHQIAARAADWRKTFDDFRHRTAVVFDGIRHDIAHYWDMIWNNTIARLNNGLQDWDRLTNGWWHDIARWFDTARHSIAAWWDTIWNNTVGRARNGVGDLMRFLGGLPGKIKGVFTSAGRWLLQAGKDVLTGLWNGMKAVWNSLTHWILAIPDWIRHHKGPVSFDRQLLVPAGRAIMQGLHTGLLAGAGGPLGFLEGLASTIGGLISSRVSGALGRVLHGGIPFPAGAGGAVQQLARAMAAQRGWTGTLWDALNAVEMREAGWNLRARNPSSGAYGIAQFIGGPAEYFRYGGNPNTAAGQVTAWLNYVAQRYRNPIAAWQHEMRFGWYGKGFHGVIDRPTLMGVGEAGRERVDITPLGKAPGRGQVTGMVVNGDVYLREPQDAQRIARDMSFRITAAGMG